MLKVSTKADYGLVVMLELARRYGEGFVSLSELAKQKHISSNYLHQVIGPLREKALIVSKEGIHGGYTLAKAPVTITVLEILETLEGPMEVVRCLSAGKAACPSMHNCDTGSVWNILQQEMKQYLRKTTLADLLKMKGKTIEKRNVSNLVKLSSL